MNAVEWSLLFLALSGLGFVFILSLCAAAAREDRRLEEAARRRWQERQR